MCMSQTPISKPKRITMRSAMQEVQAEVVSHYRSQLVEYMRSNGNRLHIPGQLTIRLAKQFGFCYGVERAIDLAYAARKVYEPPKRIFLLGEIIHNPEVNEQIEAMGIKALSSRPTEEELSKLNDQDVVIIPAFGTEVRTQAAIREKGCKIVNTTCGDVLSVYKRVKQYSRDGVTSIIHGKHWHEETKATISQATALRGHYLVTFNLEETDSICDYIVNGGDRLSFLEKFKGAYSDGFDPDKHLVNIGVANQTTMLRGETEEVQKRLKAAMGERFGSDNLANHFRFFDTICSATQDRQDALEHLLKKHMDLLLVVGGYNSSNTSHLAEMGEKLLPTFFIKNAQKMDNNGIIHHFDQHCQKEIHTEDWLPAGEVTIGITAGASCPNNLIEDTIRRVLQLKEIPLEEIFPSDVLSLS